jgi:hypothetical protein
MRSGRSSLLIPVGRIEAIKNRPPHLLGSAFWLLADVEIRELEAAFSPGIALERAGRFAPLN